jgi:hypothetical protein
MATDDRAARQSDHSPKDTNSPSPNYFSIVSRQRLVDARWQGTTDLLTWHPEVAEHALANLAAHDHVGFVKRLQSLLAVTEVDIAPAVLAGGPVRVRRVPGLPEQDSHPAPMVALSVNRVNIFG